MSGFYKGLYYNSSYELAFLLFQEKSGNFKKIERVQFYIPYIDVRGKWSHYFPDYIFDKKYLIEIKGFGPWVDLNNLSLKNKAARKWCEENNKEFRLVLKEDLGNKLIQEAKIIHNEIKIKKNNSL